MKVILLRDIKGLGKANDVKSVADGYAKNYLVPNGLAKQVDSASLGELREAIKTKELKRRLQDETLKLIQEKLKSNPLRLSLAVGEKGEVFGSITKKQVLDKLIFHLSIDKRLASEISLERMDKPIKSLGWHRIALRVGSAKGEMELEAVKS
ncbi:MAG: 50S ribosomal protein L9 [Patescibacteria group bacterium]|nr:50S ribosomal protein L9 [Patescibacteria group bacterium]